MNVKRATPVIVVEAIEPCLDFWVGRMAFDKTAEVPHGNAIGFVILEKDGVQVMLQTRASLSEDVPRLAEAGAGTATALFVEVDDIDAVERALEGVEVVQPRRKRRHRGRSSRARRALRHIRGARRGGVRHWAPRG